MLMRYLIPCSTALTYRSRSDGWRIAGKRNINLLGEMNLGCHEAEQRPRCLHDSRASPTVAGFLDNKIRMPSNAADECWSPRSRRKPCRRRIGRTHPIWWLRVRRLELEGQQDGQEKGGKRWEERVGNQTRGKERGSGQERKTSLTRRCCSAWKQGI